MTGELIWLQLSVMTKSMPLPDMVAVMTTTPQSWIQWRASKCLHYWQQHKHPQQDKTTVNGKGCNVTCHLHERHLPQLLYTTATLSFWGVSQGLT